MGRTVRVVLAALSFTAGAAGVTVFLLGEGLDRAEKWVSIVGVIVSLVLAAAGLALAWQSRNRADPEPGGRNPHVTVDNGKGVQVGDGNTQHNRF